MEYLVIFLGAAIINNFVLTRFLGLCIFFGVSRRMDTSIGMGIAVTFVMVISAMIAWPIYEWVLKPLNIEFLKIIVFIIVVAIFVQLVEMFMRKFSPQLYHAVGVYLVLIATNCIVLAVPLINVEKNFNFLQSIIHAMGSGAGFALAIVLMASIREKMELADVPPALRGLGIAFIITGLLALSFFGFSGLIKE